MTLSVAIHTSTDLVTPVVSLASTFEKAGNPVLNDAGPGRFSLLLDDADIAEVQFGRIFVITDSVSTQRFAFQIESQRRKRLDIGGKSQQVNVVSGRLLGALFEQAVVFPEGGASSFQDQTTRAFNAFNPAYDDSAWVAATAVAKQGTNPNATSQWAPPYQPEIQPPDWADGDAYWMGPSVGDWEDTPDGWWYFRDEIAVASGGEYFLDFSVDNDAELYWDGILIGDRGFGYKQTYSQALKIAGGTHVLGGRVANIPKDGNNPSGIVWTLWTNVDGDRGAVVARSSAASGMVVLNSPTVTASKGLRFAIPVPGMTVGEVLDILLTEAQDRDDLVGWTWDFTAALDSDGTAWPVEAEIVVKIGDDYLTVLRQLSQAYIDWRVDYDAKVLHAYVAGTMGSPSGVAFTAGVSVSDLEVEGEG